ncbi:MAG TPA: HlyD family type I secretion periplasmic adaptor subunit [Allosphingosinicella sp.]|jgi:adhesin transport system membrane fusion protein|nr:HlyD family type I secretion periplasmic adaptor subunit [Allosphingosinicella sp.]
MHGTHLEDLTTKLKPRAASSMLLWIILAFVVAFFLWAGLTELDRTVRGQGRVVPSSQLQVVSNLEGGVIQDILVRSGQQVRAGDPLIRLDRTQTSAEFGSGEATLSALTMKIARLEAEVGGREPAYPAASDPGLADQIRIEQSLHAARMADLSAITGAASARINQAERAVAEAQATYQSRSSAFEQRRNEARLIRPLVERGIEPRLSLVQAESAANIARSDMEAANEVISRARGGVAEARSTLAQARQEWRAQAGTELATAQAEYAARRRALPALADRASRTVLRAPLAGRIHRVLVTTRGGSIRPGEPVVEIVPSNETLLVEAQISPTDIAFVRMGQQARVAITAYDRSIYGVLEGTVVSISPDATVNERTGESFYTVKVRTAANALHDRLGTAMPIGVGMTAEVDLLGDKRSILQYILSPITRLGETALREQ